MSHPVHPRRGHQLLPHTADLIVQAWGETFQACVEEAILGLVTSFAEVDAAAIGDAAVNVIPAAAHEEQLLLALEEVVYLLDVRGDVPATTRVVGTPDGGLAVELGLVPLAAARVVGPAPKAITRHGMRLQREHGIWQVAVTVDV
ncbi:archease [Catenulispora subtropica]|uniref:Archease domain-containing protein n=1 Tax=Catenulispora subtropica TaxID=450798 RepID=A0ABP5BRP4_9ACTN